MFQFEISLDGQIRESDVYDATTRLKQIFPDLDASALEATLMMERTHALMLDERAAYYARFGITSRRFMLLRHLYLAEDRRLSMGDIAVVMNAGTPNATQIIAALVKDELVERTIGQDDKRVIYASLTQKGVEVFESVFAQNAVRLRESWTPLTEKEKRQLINMMARLRIHLLAKGANDESRDFVADADWSDESHSETPRNRRT